MRIKTHFGLFCLCALIAGSPILFQSGTARAEMASAKKDTIFTTVYYFRNSARCPTCMKIEAWSRQVVEKSFSNQMEKGILTFKAINIDEKDNKHFAKDYKLITKSLIVSQRVNGREESWKNLDKIWTLLGKESKFKNYVKEEIDNIQAQKKK